MRNFGLDPNDPEAAWIFGPGSEPSVSHYVQGRVVTLRWQEGARVQLRLTDGGTNVVSLVQRHEYGEPNGYTDEEMLEKAGHLWRSFSGMATERLELKIFDRGSAKFRQSAVVVVNLYPDGGPFKVSGSYGSVRFAPDDLTLEALLSDEPRPIRPGGDVVGERGACEATARAMPRLFPWADVELVALRPQWQVPSGTPPPSFPGLSPSQQVLANERVMALARDVLILDRASYNPEADKYYRWAVVGVDCSEGNVMNGFEGWRVTPRGPEGGMKAPSAPTVQGTRLVAEEANRELEVGLPDPTGQVSPFAPLGGWIGVLQGSRLRRGVVCEAGLLWLPDGGLWHAHRLGARDVSWARSNGSARLR